MKKKSNLSKKNKISGPIKSPDFNSWESQNKQNKQS